MRPPGIPVLPHGGDEPVFAAPWQAQAFAMVVALNERGLLPWDEWAAVLAAEIERAGGDGADYYERWLAALEEVVAARGLASAEHLERRREGWRHAAARTPHGQPIVLSPDELL